MIIKADNEGIKLLNELADTYLKSKGLAGKRLVDGLTSVLEVINPAPISEGNEIMKKVARDENSKKSNK